MNLLDYLKDKQNILADGAMGILLMQRGNYKDCPEEINLSNPGLLEEIASDYYKAGARLIQTATFGASHLKLSQYHLHRDLEKINRTAVLAVRKSVGNDAFINGVMGPCGIRLDNVNGEAINEIAENYRTQAEILLDEGVDLLSIETVMSILEAKSAVEGVMSVTGKIPVLVSFAFMKGEKGFFSLSGEKLEDCIKAVEGTGVKFIGINCGNGFNEALEITKELKNHTKLPLAVQPNAGMPDNNLNFPQTAKDFYETVSQLQKMGVSIIGGCCGTTPEYIAAVSSLFK